VTGDPELSPSDQTLLRLLHGGGGEASSEWLSLELDAAMATAGVSNCAPLRSFFHRIAACRLAPEEVAEDLSIWAQPPYVGIPAAVLVSLFDAYLACLARNAVSTLGDRPEEARRTTEAARRLAFWYLGRILASSGRQRSEDQRTILGLPGRSGFLRALRSAMDTVADDELAVLVVELRYVAPAGELADGSSLAAQLDDEAARRLAAVLRDRDVLAHLGTARFGLLLNGVQGPAHASLAASSVCAAFAASVEHAEVEVLTLPRVGIALFPEHARTPEELLQTAQTAAAEAGHAAEGWRIYDPAEHRAARLVHELAPALRRALERNALAMHFQPQVSLRSGKLVGFEALLRWIRPEGRVAPPDILAVAAQAGLARSLRRWIINVTLQQFSALRRRGVEARISLNLQPSDLGDRELADDIELAADTWRIGPESVVLEITEMSVIENLQHTMGVLRRLKARGFRISLDDFGTGFSSLTHVRRLPIDELKIDQSFVRTMLVAPDDERIVRTVIDLADTFGLDVVAEGVEDAATAQRLRQLGCSVIQGYHVSPPLGMDALSQWCDVASLNKAASGMFAEIASSREAAPINGPRV
jgi:predicted signal transduction protein with EAL and GGDEF domain